MDPNEDLGYVQVQLNATLIAVSTAIVGLRLYVRTFVTKALGWDDAICFAAYGLAVALSGMEIKAVDYGVGRHIQFVPPENLPKFFSILTTLQLCYVLDAGLVRLAIVAFLPRLDSRRVYMRWVYATGALTITITLIAFFFLLLECKYVQDIWDITNPSRQCIDKHNEAKLMAHGAIGIFIDLLLMALPMYIVSTTMRLSRRSIQVLLVFSVGLFALALGIIRLAYILTTDFAVDTTFKMIAVAPWTNAEVHVGLWVGCFPALQPLLRTVGHYVGVVTDKTRSKDGTGKSHEEGRLRVSRSEVEVEAARRSAARYAEEAASAGVSPVSPADENPWRPYLRSNSIFEEIEMGDEVERASGEGIPGSARTGAAKRVPQISEEKEQGDGPFTDVNWSK